MKQYTDGKATTLQANEQCEHKKVYRCIRLCVYSAIECACHIQQKKHVPGGIHALIEVKRSALSILICVNVFIWNGFHFI